VHVETVCPFDLQTRAGAEYLLAHSLTGAELRLRLDRIIDLQPAT
jgi:predicted DNA-binding transcriptional regulator YafY